MRKSFVLRLALLSSSCISSLAFFTELWCHIKRPNLHNAARYGDLETLKHGLECGKRVDALDSQGWTALHHAAHFGHVSELSALLAHNASVNYRHYTTGNTPLHLAAQAGHVTVVEKLLKAGASHQLALTPGTLPIQLAALGGHTAVISAMLKNRITSGDASQQDGIAAIELAAQKGHADACRLLHPTSSTRSRVAALHWAAQHGHSATVQALLDAGVAVDSENSCGWRAIHRASISGKPDVIDRLLHAGSNPSASAHKCGVSGDSVGDKAIYPMLQSDQTMRGAPLHFASRSGHLSVVQRLLQNSTAVDINEQDDDGYTPLAWAAKEGHLSIVRWFLLHGAEVNISEHHQGLLPLHLAAATGRVSVLKELMKSKADPNATDSEFGFDAFMHACKGGSIDAIAFLGPYTSEERVDKAHGWSALHIAAMNGHMQAVQWLLAKGWNVWKKDQVGWTAMHWASRGGFSQVVQVLRSASVLRPTEVKSFSVDDVAEWLHGLNMPQFVPKFIEMRVDGMQLLQLTDTKLLNDLGIRQLPFRERIMQEVNQLHKMGERATHGGEL
jgi:ankyrin repeat protein